MSGKTHISDKTKKILAGVGLGFGTIVVFLVSFILAFSLIINPINFFTVGDAESVEENEKLKQEVQTLNDKIEHLNTTVDKYKAAANAPQVPVVETVVTNPQSTEQKSQSEAQTGDADLNSETPEESLGEETENGALGEEESGFSPDTTNTTGEDTPEDVEVPITIIDVSE